MYIRALDYFKVYMISFSELSYLYRYNVFILLPVELFMSAVDIFIRFNREMSFRDILEIMCNLC